MKRLLLVPTAREQQTLSAAFARFTSPVVQTMKICGFGPIAAAASSATWIARYQPDEVILVGIAGALSDRVVVGDAYWFNEVHCDGIGVGQFDTFQPASTLGWPQWADPDSELDPIGDSLTDLHATVQPNALSLLTVCTASENPQHAEHRHLRYPHADAEEMEAFGVAISCRFAGVPLRIVRGISNVAGDRDKSHWQMDAALRSAAMLLAEIFTSA